MSYKKSCISPSIFILCLLTLTSFQGVSQGVINSIQYANVNKESYSIGALSAKWESGNRGPGTISTSYADPGGLSYGTYQISTKHGYIHDFLENEGASFCDAFKESTPGTDSFNKQWKSIADGDKDQFHLVQHNYIKRTHYDPFIKRLKRQLKLELGDYSPVLQDVIWSTAVQHGPYSKVVKNALSGLSITDLSESELISRIYAERSKIKNGKLVYFPRVKDAWQSHLIQRFDEELDQALDALAVFKPSSKHDNTYVEADLSDLITYSSKSLTNIYTDEEVASIDNSPVNVSYTKTVKHQPSKKQNYSPAYVNIVKRSRGIMEEINLVTPMHTYSYIRSIKRYVLKEQQPEQSYRIILMVLDNSEHVFENLPKGSVYIEHDSDKRLYKYYVGKYLNYSEAERLESLVYHKGVRVGRIVEY